MPVGSGFAGADVVLDDREVASPVGLVAEQPAEEVQPHQDRQQQCDDRRGGAAPQRPGQQHGNEHPEPRQEGLHQAAQVPDPVRDPRVQQQEEAQQQCQYGDHHAALPRLRPGNGARRPADPRAPRSGAAVPAGVRGTVATARRPALAAAPPGPSVSTCATVCPRSLPVTAASSWSRGLVVSCRVCMTPQAAVVDRGPGGVWRMASPEPCPRRPSCRGRRTCAARRDRRHRPDAGCPLPVKAG